ncbi:hypothetical protein F5J12DRAFT_782289 [Pisolithus orientalis]|uniref:uncharacterized protein n=1 Tax=Pisolithus orientalis TaxID=936130 RepID=UPI002224EC0E|nr:uncharacterized protein F5J12DRAFT_782289 [Pisolithus orientalis]KAI6008869.1 hypothetical protein F5J12DRAFT_782289 [Pisolithus orientalis]
MYRISGDEVFNSVSTVLMNGKYEGRKGIIGECWAMYRISRDEVFNSVSTVLMNGKYKGRKGIIDGQSSCILQDSTPNISHAPSMQQEFDTLEPQTSGPQGDIPPQVLQFMEAITKGIESTMKSMLSSAPTPRGRMQRVKSYRRREMQNPAINAKVQRLFKEKLHFTQDIEFVTHNSADPIDIHSYEFEDGPSPDSDVLVFVMMHNANSPWNSTIIDLLLQELHTQSMEENWPTAQPMLTKHGVIKTPAEMEAWLIEEREEVLKLSHQTTCCHNKFMCRATILEHIMKLKTNEGDANAAAWTWLQDLVLCLGEHGGSQPMRRIHAPRNHKSGRTPVKGLLIALYDDTWIKGLSQ